PHQLLWDVGLGSGSVAIEWLLAHPTAKAIGFERNGERAARARHNAIALGVPELEVRQAAAPAAFEGAPAPNAVFIGGGVTTDGLLEACWEALRSGGRIVANAVTLEGQVKLAAARETYGGELIRIGIERLRGVGRFHGLEPAMAVLQWTGEKPWP